MDVLAPCRRPATHPGAVHVVTHDGRVLAVADQLVGLRAGLVVTAGG